MDRREKAEYKDPAVQIITEDVHMAHGISTTDSTAAALHTEILKNSGVESFLRHLPRKIQQQNNGITFRRWLMHANPSYLTHF